jgi:nucleotide-binding universal stress UspA family protein
VNTGAWFGRVVVGYDGSETAKVAARWAADEAVAQGRGLTLAHAVLPPVSGAGFGATIPPPLDLVDSLQEKAKIELLREADALPGTDIEVCVEIGSPSGLLLDASQKAHLLVLGSRGHGGFRGLLLGSVGSQVASHAACPTVIFREPRVPDSRHLVVGIDGSPNSEVALAFGFDMASRHGWELIAVHAWEVPAYDLIVVPSGPVPVPLTDVADDEVRLAAEVLAGFRADFPDVHVHERLVRAAPADALLTEGKEAAMIVVGTRGRGPTAAAVLGSVSNAVLHKARVPVAVVPYEEPDGDAA